MEREVQTLPVDTGVTTTSVALNTKEAAAAQTPAEEKVLEPGKLSRKDALEVGYEAAKSVEPKERNTPKPVKKKEVEIAQIQDKPKHEAPSEYTPEEREWFSKATPEQQATSLRLFESAQRRRADLNREKRELDENGWVKDLVKDINPFLQATGEKLKPHEALTAALRLRQELETGDPVQNAIRLLERKGIEIPEALTKMAEGDKVPEDAKYKELRAELDSIKKEKETEKLQNEATSFLSDWEVFQNQTNAAKAPMFPDVNNSEAGHKMAADIGSLVGGRTEVSKQFIAKVRERLPNAGRVELFTQAYRFLGGRVDESQAPITNVAKTTHIQRSNRAAASVPGSGNSFNPEGRVKLSRKEANARAYKELMERNG